MMTCHSENMENKMKEIMSIVERKRRASAGHCGVYPVELLNKTGLEWNELSQLLERLIEDKKLIKRPGHHGELIFRKLKK